VSGKHEHFFPSPPLDSSKNNVFTRVGTYVQGGSKFCFVVVVVLVRVVLVGETLLRIDWDPWRVL
jgi:hypothetical protein